MELLLLKQQIIDLRIEIEDAVDRLLTLFKECSKEKDKKKPPPAYSNEKRINEKKLSKKRTKKPPVID